MPNLGDLVSLGVVAGNVAWAVRFSIRDVLDYRVKREMLRLLAKDQEAIAGRKRRNKRR